MKQVLSLVGRNAGQVIWMHNPNAEACVANGTAIWPEDAGKARVKGVHIPVQPEHDDAGDRVHLPIRTNEDRKIVLVGPWPSRAILTSKLLWSNMVEMSSGGDVHIRIGARAAKYKAIREFRSGEWYIDLREVHDEVEEEAEVEPETDGDGAAGAVPESDDDDGPNMQPLSDGGGIEAGAEAKSEVTDITGWKSLHWKQKIELAARVSGQKVETTAKAKEILIAYEDSQA